MMTKFINEVMLLTNNPKQYELVEFKLYPSSLIEEVKNPFNYDEVNIECTFTPENGKGMTLKAFWTKEAVITLDESTFLEEEGSHGIAYYAEGEPF